MGRENIIYTLVQDPTEPEKSLFQHPSLITSQSIRHISQSTQCEPWRVYRR
jgi:hypothetical protein